MTRTISQRELRNESGEILRAVDRGEEFIVTRNGVPVAELRPIRHYLIPTDRLRAALRRVPRIDADEFRRSVDAILDQSPDPRV